MSTPTYETLEEAQAGILDLEAKIVELTNERDTLSQNNERLTTELAQSRQHAQELFLKVRAQFHEQEDENNDEEEEVPSCVDFARTHNIL